MKQLNLVLIGVLLWSVTSCKNEGATQEQADSSSVAETPKDTSSNQEQPTNTSSQTIAPIEPLDTLMYDQLAAIPELDTLVSAIYEALLTKALNDPGPFTIFAPIDDAWKSIPPDRFNQLTRGFEAGGQLRDIFSMIVVPGRYRTADLKHGQLLTTFGQYALRAKKNGNQTTIEGATILYADIPCTNGVIHIVDKILVPPEIDLNKMTPSPFKKKENQQQP